MNKFSKKIDKNQPGIVKELRDMGYSVVLDKDDIIVGSKGHSLWIEIKECSPFGKDRKLKAGDIKDSQYKILWNWKGQYSICWETRHILNAKVHGLDPFERGITPVMFRQHYKEWLSEKELKRLRFEEIIVDTNKTNDQLFKEYAECAA